MAKARDEKSEASPATGSAAGAGPSATGAGGNAMMDLDFVRGLIEVVDGSGIDSIEITRAGTRVKISKTPPAPAGPSYYGMPGVAGPPPAAVNSAPTSPSPAPAAPAAVPEASPAPAEAEGGASDLAEVKSPMVGTFYRAPAPEAPPYVEVGTRVSRGQTLCILEAMKLMNELESEVEGVVREVLVENAEPVEYGQVLFRIDPSG